MVEKTKYKHIHFEEYEDSYQIINNKSGTGLGGISYYKPWKKYVVYFDKQAIFDETCLLDIVDFLKQLNG